MRKLVSRAILAVALMTLAAGSIHAPVHAAAVPTGYQEYIVLGNDRHLWEMFNYYTITENPGQSRVRNAMLTVVSVTASTDNQIVVYDHWEDGFETGLIDPSSPNYLNPAQATTMIFGNGDSSDGRACDFKPGAVCTGFDPADDLLFQGDTLTLHSDEGTATTVPPCQASTLLPPQYPANLLGCVPTNPTRNAAYVRFDGGDFVAGSGGPLAVIRIADPEMITGAGTAQGVVAGATEMISSQAVGNAIAYFIPIGEDIYAGNGSVTEPFKYVYLDLTAYHDDTHISILSPGSGGGTVSLTLDKGQHYSSRGYIDNAAATAIRITAGTKVSTDKPVSGVIFNAGDGTYSVNLSTLLPDILHATQYISTAAGDDTASGDNPANLYIFNPDPARALSVTITDSGGTQTASVQPSSQRDFVSIMGRDIATGSTIRLTSDRNFWGVSSYDYNQTAFDWGYSWLANKFLTTLYTIPYSPDSAGGGAPAHIAPTLDRTCVWIDFDNDGVYDPISNLAGGTIPTLGAGACAGGYQVDALQDLMVTDPTDFDNTGTRIVTSKPVAIAYGQNTDRAVASNAGVNYRDYGYVVYPVNQAFLDPVLTVDKTSVSNRVSTAGGTVTYIIEVRAHDFGPLTSLNILDTLPAGAAYVAGSTIITYPDLSQESGASANPDVTGQTLDWTSKLDVTTLSPLEIITIRYAVTLPGGAPTILTNEARALGTIGSSIFSPSDTHQVTRTDITLTKAANDDGTPEPSDIITYSLTVANPGAAGETGIYITDAVPPDATFVTGSIGNAGPFSGTFDSAQNAVIWTAANFAAGSGPYTLSFQARINPTAAAGTFIRNAGIYESNETPYLESDTLATVVVGPVLAVSKSIVGAPAAVHPLQQVTYEVSVSNTGSGQATDLWISDQLPANAAYLAGSLAYSLNNGPFSSLTDAAGDDYGTVSGLQLQFSSRRHTYADYFATVAYTNNNGTDNWAAAWVETDSGGGGAGGGNVAIVTDLGDGSLRLQVANQSIYRQANLSGYVKATLTYEYRRAGLDSVDEFVTVEASPNGGGTWYELQRISGIPTGSVTDAAYTRVVRDLTPYLAANTRIRFRTNPAAGMDNTDQVFFDNVEISALAAADVFTLPAGQNLTLRFTVTPNAGTGGQTLNNQALTGADQVTATPSELVQVPIVGNATVTGHVFIDSDNDGTQDAGEPDMANITVFVTDSGGVVFTAVTDANGDYSVVVPAGATILNVDENDADFPPGGTLSTGNDPQTVTAVGGGTVASGNVGYYPTMPLTISKISNASAQGIAPGDTVTYSIRLDNFSALAQNNLVINDTLPAGLTYVSQSTVLVGWDFVRDQFDAIAFSNNDGSRNWSNNWQETDTGGGVAGAGGGNVRVIADLLNQRLQIFDNDQIAWRQADLSGATSATLTFLYRRFSLDRTDEYVRVQVRRSGGDAWTTLATYSNGNDNAYQSASFDISAYISGTTQISFNSTGARAQMDNAEGVFFDNIDIDFGATTRRNNGGAYALANGVPPNLTVAGDRVRLLGGKYLTLTFQATYAALNPAITSFTNTASTTNGSAPSDSVVDAAIRPAVTIDPNAAVAVPYSATSARTVTFTQLVANLGQRYDMTNSAWIGFADAFSLKLISEHGWKLELLDPATGAVIATDSNGDGTWDAATPNTGTLASGASREYLVRVTVPAGAAAPPGTMDTVRLTATSGRSSLVADTATSEITVLDNSIFTGDVLLTPDQNGSGLPGSRLAYTHTLTNRSGSDETFTLLAVSSHGWPVTFYQDSNGDGRYTAGVDVAIVQSRTLANGESQTFFAVVSIPAGAAANTVDQTEISAIGNGSSNLIGFATDTTVVIGGQYLGFNLSGGGSHMINPGNTDVFPGTLINQGTTAETFSFAISPSDYGPAGPLDDDLAHPTALWFDTNGDGTIDTSIAEDTDGNGTWDYIDPAFLVSGQPALTNLPAGASRSYELRREVSLDQMPYRDPVTLSATSSAGGATKGITAVTISAAPTQAVIADVRARRDEGGVVVSWVTLSEYRTIGFHLERLDEESGAWERVNGKLLPGLITSRAGGRYRCLDPDAPASGEVIYRIIEVEASGRKLPYGPYRRDPDAPEADASSQLQAAPAPGEFIREARMVASQRPLPAPAPPSSSPPPAMRTAAELSTARAKVSIAEKGLYTVSREAIAEALGCSPDRAANLIARNRIRLTNRAKAVALRAAADHTAVYFYAEPLDKPYSHDNVYWLSIGSGVRMKSVTSLPVIPGSGPAFFAERLVAEQNLVDIPYLFTDPEADFWMWDYVFPDYGSDSFTVSVASPGAVDGPAAITIELYGGNTTSAAADHHAVFRLNGALIGETHWDGMTTHAWTAPVDAALLHDGDNTLEVLGVRDDGVEYSIFYLNRVSLTYSRRCTASDNRLEITSDGISPVTIDGFTSASVRVFDITYPRRPRVVRGAIVDQPRPGEFRVTFHLGETGRRFLAIAADARGQAHPVTDAPSNLASAQGAEYLVITRSDMIAAARNIADLRAARGMSTLVIDLQDIYDEFAAGIPDPRAIKSFLGYAAAYWPNPPRYVLLAGEGTYDYLDNLGLGAPIVPVIMVATPDGLFPSDTALADFSGGDGIPDLAIGRVPARTADELAAFAAKLAAFESAGDAPWRHRAILCADAPDRGGEFTTDSDTLAALFPADMTLQRIYLDAMTVNVARTALRQDIAAGAAFLNFVGHGGFDGIGNDNLLGVADIPSLGNGERLPVVSALTCLAGGFGFPGTVSFSDELVIADNGGAIAVWAPSGLALNSHSVRLAGGFYRSLFGDSSGVLGQAALGAAREYSRAAYLPYLPLLYNLTGDPATEVR